MDTYNYSGVLSLSVVLSFSKPVHIQGSALLGDAFQTLTKQKLDNALQVWLYHCTPRKNEFVKILVKVMS